MSQFAAYYDHFISLYLSPVDFTAQAPIVFTTSISEQFSRLILSFVHPILHSQRERKSTRPFKN